MFHPFHIIIQLLLIPLQEVTLCHALVTRYLRQAAVYFVKTYLLVKFKISVCFGQESHEIIIRAEILQCKIRIMRTELAFEV